MMGLLKEIQAIQRGQSPFTQLTVEGYVSFKFNYSSLAQVRKSP